MRLFCPWSALAAEFIPQYSHSTIISPTIMGIVGNLRTMQLEELLQWLSQSKKSGTLEIVHGRTEKKIFFKDGLILSSASNKPEEYLGHFLVSHGLINETQLSRAIDLQEKSRMLLGMIASRPKRASTTSFPGKRGTSAFSTTSSPRAPWCQCAWT